MYGIETKVSGSWRAINPPCGPPPYCFKTEAEAEALARVLFPELMRLKRGELIRIAHDGVREAGTIRGTKP